jgi:hypothetical protein
VPWYEYSVTPGGLKPYVEVRLWNGNQSVRLLAIVDSGADTSFLDGSYADLLGLDRAQAVTTNVVVASGGSAQAMRWPNVPLELQFENERFPYLGMFADFPAGSDPENLMGRQDFFERFIIQFWDAQNLMCIDLSPDLPILGHTP